MKKIAFVLTIISAMVALNSFGRANCSPAEKWTTDFLNLLEQGKIGEAKRRCTPNGVLFIDSCIATQANFKINKVSDVKCKIRREEAICGFCCANDSLRPVITMIRNERGMGCNSSEPWWLIDDLRGMTQKEQFYERP